MPAGLPFGPKYLAFLRPFCVSTGVMAHHLAKLLFPHDQRSARRRKMRVLWMTILGGLLASTLIALTFIWIHYSGRF
jgi:hypothetical protein